MCLNLTHDCSNGSQTSLKFTFNSLLVPTLTMLKPDNLPVTFGKNDVEIIARETLYRGFFSLDLYRFRHRLFNGQMSHEVRREIFERGHAAVLLPFDPVRDEVVLIEQIRIAAYDTSETPATGDGCRDD